MSKKITSIDAAPSVLLSQEAVDAVRVGEGRELEIEIAQDAQRSRQFGKIFESLLKRRREAYEHLADGPE